MYKDENNTLSINNNTETVVKGTKGDASTVSVENRISGQYFELNLFVRLVFIAKYLGHL